MAHLRPASAGQAISRGADWASAGEAATPRRSAREILAKAAARMVPLRRCQPQDGNGSGGPALPDVRNAGRWCPNQLLGHGSGIPHARALVSYRIRLIGLGWRL